MLAGIIYSAVTGGINAIGEVILTSSTEGFNLFFKVALLLIFWNGMFNIAIESGMIKSVCRIMKPLLYRLFPEVPKDSNLFDYISANIMANILGLAAASTPLGLKTIEEMQKINPHPQKASRSMITLLLLNISSLTIFPSTIISLMSAYNSKDTDLIYVLLILTTSITTLLAIILDRFLARKANRKEEER
jgi:spore maturation protein A